VTPFSVNSSIKFTTTASGRYLSLNPFTNYGNVAENIKIYLSLGNILTIFSIIG